MSLNQKLFVCFWASQAYVSADVVETHDQPFFSEENGYSGKDTALIDDLEIGHSYCNHDHGPNSHIVTRVR